MTTQLVIWLETLSSITIMQTVVQLLTQLIHHTILLAQAFIVDILNAPILTQAVMATLELVELGQDTRLLLSLTETHSTLLHMLQFAEHD